MAITPPTAAAIIEISIENQILVEEPTNFTLRFIESSTGILLDDVHYSIEVVDTLGNKITNILELYAQNGIDSQSVTFNETGPITFSINIAGTGADRPYDSEFSGQASVIFTVVPEFPFGVILSLGAVIGLAILFPFLKSELFIQKKF